MIRGGQSCRVPNRLLQKFAKGRGIFSDSLWIAVAHDIEALAAIQNEIQFISHLCAFIFALIVGDELTNRMNLVKSCRSLEPIAVKDQIRGFAAPSRKTPSACQKRWELCRSKTPSLLRSRRQHIVLMARV